MKKLLSRQSSGQTLIETIVAAGVLTTGIIGGLALAIASLGSSDQVMQQIVATGLAREGVEVVRRIRDANWNAGSLSNCDSLFGTTDSQQCYQTWDSSIEGTAGGSDYRAIFNPASNSWSFVPTAIASETRLYLRSDSTYSHSGSGDWRYSRQITISRDTVAPFSAANPRLYVRSTVWWNNKRCPTTDNPATTQCKVIVEEYLTNWKNF